MYINMGCLLVISYVILMFHLQSCRSGGLNAARRWTLEDFPICTWLLVGSAPLLKRPWCDKQKTLMQNARHVQNSSNLIICQSSSWAIGCSSSQIQMERYLAHISPICLINFPLPSTADPNIVIVFLKLELKDQDDNDENWKQITSKMQTSNDPYPGTVGFWWFCQFQEVHETRPPWVQV